MNSNSSTDDEYDTIMDSLRTRRKVLAGTAAIGAAALAGCSGNGDTGDGGMGGGETATPMDGETSNPDVDVLNYALTLEHLEHAFYRDGLEEFTNEQLRNAEQVSAFGGTVRQAVPARIDTIRAHEKGHVQSLTGVIEDLGGEPAGEATYTFEYESPKTFLATAKVLENTGVAAYKGAAPAIKSNEILASALGIHSVEARHASFLNTINRTTPYPGAFDAPKSPSAVLDAANPFFESDVSGAVSMSDLAGDDEPTAARTEDDGTSDVDVLNYALTLEHLEHAFYRDGLEQFSDDEIRDAEALSGFGEEVRQSAPERLASVRDHEKAHVDVITETVGKLGGDPVGEAEYEFPYETPSEFLGVAKALENTGVAAYAGAAPSVSNDEVFFAAAKIHSVEARHAGFLNELNGESAFPAAVDAPKSMEEVTEIASQFIK